MNNRLGKGIGALINSQNLDKGEYLDGFIEVDSIKTNSNQPKLIFTNNVISLLLWRCSEIKVGD